MTGYDEAHGLNDDPKYGELEFSYTAWGNELANTNIMSDLGVHPCSDEELGLVKGPNTKFYPIWESSIEEVRLY